MAQDFEQALDQEMKTITAFSGRVYPLFSPKANAGQGIPYLIYSSSAGRRTKTQDGYQSGREVRGELNVISNRYADLKSLTNAAIDQLISFEQRRIGTDGPLIQEVTYQQPVELYEEDPKLYRCLIEYEVYY
ncbi:DUF3168 domain-containing protein [Paenibacillus sp. sptzw28]|uniref:DUF3168 domain-containing protein n=1 Tax=Paenibacillus sp. sptzw28 TaxID=715179 RepID=UPI001C6EC316|nr:DUF3168 domain-containing protein [Paenibacillus sp. sptzw28]QYR20802.1 DUF3168 domain-containing protein [Paenibacillus sp. sptzw28]